MSETRRGCGYRKHKGLYLCSDGPGHACDRLPHPLVACPTCGAGFHASLGWTWVETTSLFGGPHNPCLDKAFCTLCKYPEKIGRAGLLWIGGRFYATPEAFIEEGQRMGYSRRIKAVPRGFKVGESWVLLAHAHAIRVAEQFGEEDFSLTDEPPQKAKYTPGIFQIWRPSRVEKVFFESEKKSDEVKAAMKQGLTPVFVPEDPKHQGSVYDEEEENDE